MKRLHNNKVMMFPVAGNTPSASAGLESLDQHINKSLFCCSEYRRHHYAASSTMFALAFIASFGICSSLSSGGSFSGSRNPSMKSECVMPAFVAERAELEDYDPEDLDITESYRREDLNKEKSYIDEDFDRKIMDLKTMSDFRARADDYALVVDKETQRALLIRIDYSIVDVIPVSTGRNPGNKERTGDARTPNGPFKIDSIQRSSSWKYNGRYSYGDYFLRLNAGSWNTNGNHDPGGRSSIGIHGTDEPEKLGTPASDGCVRIPNEKISRYVEYGILKKGSAVMILDEARYRAWGF